jgi:SAM-dependent methyltransferase
MARKKRTGAEAQLAFEALSIESGLLSPEWLSRVAQLAASHQTEPEYRVPKGLNLRDEIGRYWRIAQAHWADLAAGRARNADAAALAERFVLALLKDSFGFTTIAKAEPITLAERVYPIGHSAIGTRVPIVIAPAGTGLDALAEVFADGKRRRSAFGLVQEYLNAEDAALWGIVSDGHMLRIARDNASLTRPAWIEADLARMFTEERFADFAALWLLAHETRFGEADQPVHECPLETWREAGREQGTRARDKLRNGVEDALAALGQGFLAHPGNQALRAALQSGELSTKDLFNQLLRLVYRIIFLLTVEERGLLHPEGTDEKAKQLYVDGYAMRRLRERAVKRSAHDRFADLWEATKIVFGGLALGEPRLGLPALAGIFDRRQCPALDAAKLENRHLLLAVFKLSWIRDDSSLSRVNWRDMGPEELGSVYESLLELVPQIAKDGRQFTFATGGETKGNARKTSGSYYTPDSLVQVLLDSALEPVVADTIARSPDNPIDALLALSIVDPACGSGHFLLAAARRLAAHVARLAANGTPSAAEYRHAVRQVIGCCVYGVDLNPMAVELCRVSLWMEAVEPGLPLTFLTSHIQHGNALLGTTPELMAKGIPDVAWNAIEGDDKKVASALKKRNKAAAKVEYGLDLRRVDPVAEREAVARAVSELEGASDADVAQLAQKESRWDGILGSNEYQHQKLVADAWCAAFVWPKQQGALAEAAPTNELWRLVRDGQAMSAQTTKTVAEIAEQYRFFHWHLQFPQVFARNGFDVLLGNPPWERVKLQEQEFFAPRSAAIADAPNAAARKKLIARLPEVDATLWGEWCAASREAEGESQIIRTSGRYPLCGRGDVNTYAVFAELCSTFVSPTGRAGIVVPTNIATDDTTKDYFSNLLGERRFVSLFDFENVAGARLFVDGNNRRFRFCAMTIAGSQLHDPPLFVAVARNVDELRDRSRQYSLSIDDVARINPLTKTLPMFRTRRDAEITAAIYSRIPILATTESATNDAWRINFMTMFHMSGDSDVFRPYPDPDTLPLYEAKMFFHYDDRYGDYRDRAPDSEWTRLPDVPLERLRQSDYRPTPRYWVPATEVASRMEGKSRSEWHLCWRDICRAGDERTMVAAILPRAGVGHTAPMIVTQVMKPEEMTFLYAVVCSFAFDYVVRQKTGGIHLTFSVMNQLPVLPPTVSRTACGWAQGSVGEWVGARVLELAYTSWELKAFAEDVGYRGPPFVWDPARREILRAELDAAMFILYGLSRDEADYILETFASYDSAGKLYSGVKGKDFERYGEYRTKRIILEIYDAMAAAARILKPYQSRLDPPPADPRVAHPPSEGGKVIPLPLIPAVRPQPTVAPAAVVPDLTAVVANAWMRPHSLERGEIQAVIVAVLKTHGAPMDRRQARLAALLCLEPHLLASMLDKTEKAQWARVVGGDAEKVASASIDATSQEWGAAVTGLRGRERVLENLQQNTWALGTGTEAIDTSGWPEGRAGFVVNVLRRLQQSTQVDAIILKLPATVQQWLANAA